MPPNERNASAAMRTPIRLVSGVLLAALVFGAAYWLLDRRSDPAPDAERRAAPSATSSTSTLPTTTLPPTTTTTLPPGLPLPLDPGPTRLAWAGDSVAATLAAAVAAEANARGFQVVDRTTSGCGMVRGDPADDALVPISFVRSCGGSIPDHHRVTAASGADVVAWLSTWETSNRIVDGQGYVFGTPEADAMLLGLIDESVQTLTSGGARLVMLTMPPNTTGPNRPVVTETDSQRALHLNELLRRYAAAHADRVAILDLAAIVCPTGPPCPTEVEGVTLRPVDGGHFAGDGPAWVAPRVLDRLVGPA